jgi:hypothetical protein
LDVTSPVFRQVWFASDPSFARKAVREIGTRCCHPNTSTSCIRQHRVEEHDVLIGEATASAAAPGACRRRGKFRPRLGPEGSDHTDHINLVATGEGVILETQFVFEKPW